MDIELKKRLTLLANKGALVNGLPVSTTFDNTTDSLENIRDELVVTDAAVDAVQADLGDMIDTATADSLADITTTSAHAKLRRLLLRFSADAFAATIQGASKTDVENMLQALANYFSAAGAAWSVTANPGGTAKDNLEQTLEDFSDMLAGGTGIVTWPNGVAPGNGVSIAEGLRATYEALISQGTTDFNATAKTSLQTASAAALAATAYKRQAGVTQIFTKQITSAADAGAVTVATITTKPCFMRRIVVRSNDATTANLTNITITGGASNIVTYIDAVTGVRANIAAADQQIAWEGASTLAATKTITITLTGTGVTTVDLQVDIEYCAVEDTGYLA